MKHAQKQDNTATKAVAEELADSLRLFLQFDFSKPITPNDYCQAITLACDALRKYERKTNP